MPFQKPKWRHGDTEAARVDIGKELGQELSLDITDTTLTTDLVGEVVSGPALVMVSESVAVLSG
jgi:hypothetical protein